MIILNNSEEGDTNINPLTLDRQDVIVDEGAEHLGLQQSRQESNVGLNLKIVIQPIENIANQ